MRHLYSILTIAALGAAVSCSDGSTGPGDGATGRVQLHLTDAPFPLDSVESIDVFIVRVEARLAASTEAEAGADVDEEAAADNGWVVLAEPNASFNLMELQGGITTPLGDAEIAAGSYQSMRLILDTDQSSVTLVDGFVLSGDSEPSILFPSGAQTGIKILFSTPIEVEADATTQVLVDFDAGESFVVRGNTILQNGLLFKPVIRASVTQ
jgi:hypothetical protein